MSARLAGLGKRFLSEMATVTKEWHWLLSIFCISCTLVLGGFLINLDGESRGYLLGMVIALFLALVIVFTMASLFSGFKPSKEEEAVSEQVNKVRD